MQARPTWFIKTAVDSGTLFQDRRCAIQPFFWIKDFSVLYFRFFSLNFQTPVQLLFCWITLKIPGLKGHGLKSGVEIIWKPQINSISFLLFQCFLQKCSDTCVINSVKIIYELWLENRALTDITVRSGSPANFQSSDSPKTGRSPSRTPDFYHLKKFGKKFKRI